MEDGEPCMMSASTQPRDYTYGSAGTSTKPTVFKYATDDSAKLNQWSARLRAQGNMVYCAYVSGQPCNEVQDASRITSCTRT